MSSSKEHLNIGVFTSGGDAPGMNAGVRAIVRLGIEHGFGVYAIHDGYKGMVEGGDSIRRCAWNDVQGILSRGGTLIGTARSKEFRTREGRQQACLNLVRNGINCLVCIGGDGSLTGADIFRREWPEHLDELVKNNSISEQVRARCSTLRVVGFVGTIDNDMCGSDFTIGSDSALTRIVDAIDCLASTADSHTRTFIIEVMGRHCGYLALVSALITGATFTIYPESPPTAGTHESWEKRMLALLEAHRSLGHRSSIIVLCEGAVDIDGKPISSEYVKQVLCDDGFETRVSILGHIQRGGKPSAQDRYLATVMAAAAVDHLANNYTEPALIGCEGQRVCVRPLMTCVRDTVKAGDELKAAHFAEALRYRSPAFRELSEINKSCLSYQLNANMDGLCGVGSPSSGALKGALKGSRAKQPACVGIFHVGAPAPGMNMAVMTMARLLICGGHRCLGFRDGLEGLAHNYYTELNWQSVEDFQLLGGAMLGCKRLVIGDNASLTADAVAATVRRHNLSALVMIGGFEGYRAMHSLMLAKETVDGLNIPMICIPATISCNTPFTDASIGCDRAITNLIESIDKVKESAVSIQRCFIVECMGRECGYLALMGALLCGAEGVLLPEKQVTLNDVERMVQDLKERFSESFSRAESIADANSMQEEAASIQEVVDDGENGGAHEAVDGADGGVEELAASADTSASDESGAASRTLPSRRRAECGTRRRPRSYADVAASARIAARSRRRPGRAECQFGAAPPPNISIVHWE